MRLVPAYAPRSSPILALLPRASPFPRAFSTSHLLQNQPATPPLPPSEDEPKRHAIGQINRRLQITFTCTAPVPKGEADDAAPCGHRSTHEFSRRSYEKGIVLIECPGCGNRHLIGASLLRTRGRKNANELCGVEEGS